MLISMHIHAFSMRSAIEVVVVIVFFVVFCVLVYERPYPRTYRHG